jgi:hypothetical protein
VGTPTCRPLKLLDKILYPPRSSIDRIFTKFSRGPISLPDGYMRNRIIWASAWGCRAAAWAESRRRHEDPASLRLAVKGRDLTAALPKVLRHEHRRIAWRIFRGLIVGKYKLDRPNDMAILVKDVRSIIGHLGRRPGRGGRQPSRVHKPPVVQARLRSVSRLRVGIFFLIFFCPATGEWGRRFRIRFWVHRIQKSCVDRGRRPPPTSNPRSASSSSSSRQPAAAAHKPRRSRHTVIPQRFGFLQP